MTEATDVIHVIEGQPALERAAGDCSVIELRQYTLHPGHRDRLIDLFEREFVESQEACGMDLIGQFRDLDDANRFVWLRGFRDMPSRAKALASFYGGPVWKAHREAANATMVDSDNVLLLRPARADSGFAPAPVPRAAIGALALAAGLVVAMIWPLPPDVDADFGDAIERRVAPIVQAAGGTLLARFVSESAMNTFPALPVREGENVVVCFAGFADAAAKDRLADVLGRSGNPAAPQILYLAPTPRSRLRG